MRALSRHSDAESTCDTCTPNRNGFMILYFPGEPRDDRRERVDRVVLDDVVRHLPAFAPFFERRDDLVLAADEARRREPRVVDRHAERVGDAFEDLRGVVGHVDEPDERLQLEIVEAVAGRVAHPPDLLVGRLRASSTARRRARCRRPSAGSR